MDGTLALRAIPRSGKRPPGARRDRGERWDAIKQDSVLRPADRRRQRRGAEAIVSGLRNGGIAVRPSRPENGRGLVRCIGGQPLDLVLAAQSAKSCRFATVMQAVDASGKDLPVLLVVDTLDDDTLLLAPGTPACAASSCAAASTTCRRCAHRMGRPRGPPRAAPARSPGRETERRCDALIDSSRDPIAYVHEGMHIRANAAYLEMFGFESFEDIEGMSLLDLIAPSHVDRLQAAAQEAVQGRSAAAAPRARGARPRTATTSPP